MIEVLKYEMSSLKRLRLENKEFISLSRDSFASFLPSLTYLSQKKSLANST